MEDRSVSRCRDCGYWTAVSHGGRCEDFANALHLGHEVYEHVDQRHVVGAPGLRAPKPHNRQTHAERKKRLMNIWVHLIENGATEEENIRNLETVIKVARFRVRERKRQAAEERQAEAVQHATHEIMQMLDEADGEAQ